MLISTYANTRLVARWTKTLYRVHVLSYAIVVNVLSVFTCFSFVHLYSLRYDQLNTRKDTRKKLVISKNIYFYGNSFFRTLRERAVLKYYFSFFVYFLSLKRWGSWWVGEIAIHFWFSKGNLCSKYHNKMRFSLK